ncbi:dihydrofolate reductase family protein [Actinomadura madurae]|uniref:dihydrofolate reductase family protein n=1 Tax=Actinomadura madurae TaxID=1993 RepID=UPI00202728E2|nr:dihydrofolate reductase family protein [Actinomadura madurae]MCP9953374.1 dihydrofolate reductase family protein [Actinomadura madurae]MCP9970135.1 dihydrofolate reductase family protein [Actinomadura madurae]MCQ0005860.1 dihydrofolate reductase family protein [Actinomadura madurae]URM98834.1 dihydrofolate reductase family protein [Actinomadura madurae]URN09527.1 dihydrofolate reductase family protein [Actinomadura madurae]
MRKIISSTYISLDGVIENPQNWTSAYFQDEAAAYAQELLFSCGALLMGRRTFDGFSQAWPAMEEATGDFGVRMNTLPHYVVSDTLRKPGWGDTTVIPRAEAVAEITKLKEQDGQDILQYGFGPVSRTLVEHGLLDELRLWIHPVVVGPGDPTELLTHKDFSATFELAGTTTFETGVIIATYVPAKK